MAKSNKGKVVQMLTPENYIRKKARSLPIFECLVASEWEESGLPTVVIARKHTNGNITACTYLVDLKCLGVKDSSYLFNVSMTQYRDFKEMILENIELTPVDYTLAHNIVLAGVEYAEELGFKPYKDYESVTKYMLEEDTDEIELIEIECGKNGKPFYIQGPYEDDAKVKKTIAQLEKAVGHGNYEFMPQVGNPFIDTYPEEDEEEEDEFKGMTLEEKRALFLTLVSGPDVKKEEGALRLIHLTNSMVINLLDENQYELYYDHYLEALDLEVSDDEIPDQLLGINPGEQVVSEELKKRFYDLFLLCNEDPKRAERELKSFKKEANNIPGVYLLELLLIQNKSSRKYGKRLEEYARLFPDYEMIRLLGALWQLDEMEESKNIPEDLPRTETFFTDRKSIHSVEYMYLLMVNSIAAGMDMNINKIEAFMNVVYNLDLPPVLEKIIVTTNSAQKFAYIFQYLKESLS